MVVQDFLQEAKQDGLIQGGTVASDSAHIDKIWQLRENISVALNKAGLNMPHELTSPNAFGLLLQSAKASNISHMHVGIVWRFTGMGILIPAVAFSLWVDFIRDYGALCQGPEPLT